MQNKKLIISLGILVVLVGAAAFIGGRFLNQGVNPLGLLPMGDGGIMAISVQVTPAPELPTTEPEVIGLFVERKDNSIFVSNVSMSGGGGGVVVQSGGGSSPGQFVSDLPDDGPRSEVVITNETIIYLETTQPDGAPGSGENLVIQQTVAEGSLDDLTSQSFVTVWGRKSGDRIIAEILFISNPIMIQSP